jgi:glycogen operon protein
MTDADWDTGYAKSLGVFLNGHAIPDRDRHGHQISDDSFFLLFNAWEQTIDFTLPAATWGGSWTVLLDTSTNVRSPSGASYQAGSTAPLLGRHFLLMKRD